MQLQRLEKPSYSGQDCLRHRIVCGIRDKGLQRSFLEDSKLTSEKCVEKCKAAEQAKKHTAEIIADPNRPASKGEQQDVFVARQITLDKRQSHPGKRQQFHNGTGGAQSVGSSTRSCSFCSLIHAYSPQQCPSKGNFAIAVEDRITLPLFAVSGKSLNVTESSSVGILDSG